ncbi:MAG: VanZ family protein [Solirubrobacterales bacterium]
MVSAGVLLTLTHIPQAAMPRFLNEHMLDKVEHVLAYGWVALLFLLSVRDHTRLAVPMIGLLVLAGMGILDETTQPLVNRIASVGDYASDVVGILLALLIFLVKRRFRFDTTAL